VFAINVKAVATGSQVNTTTAVTSANGGAGNAATASISVLGPILAPNLIIAKSHAGTFVKGQTGEYTITVSNIGEDPTAGTVTVTDTLPAGLTATSLSGAGWTCTLVSLSCTRSDALGAALREGDADAFQNVLVVAVIELVCQFLGQSDIAPNEARQALGRLTLSGDGRREGIPRS
jgi:uncharacterized repeat protein (TIGR01451 family)